MDKLDFGARRRPRRNEHEFFLIEGLREVEQGLNALGALGMLALRGNVSNILCQQPRRF